MLVAPNLKMPEESKMPIIKLKSSSIVDNVDLRGEPTASGTSNIATTQMVNQEISNLIGSSPELLNTLNEMAQALSIDGDQTQ